MTPPRLVRDLQRHHVRSADDVLAPSMNVMPTSPSDRAAPSTTEQRSRRAFFFGAERCCGVKQKL